MVLVKCISLAMFIKILSSSINCFVRFFVFCNRKRVEKNLLHYRKILDRQGQREVINPRPCSHMCCCCHCQGCEKVSTTTISSGLVLTFQDLGS